MESCGDVDDFQKWPVMGETSFWPGARRGFFASHKRPLSNSPSLRSRGLPTNGICDPTAHCAECGRSQDLPSGTPPGPEHSMNMMPAEPPSLPLSPLVVSNSSVDLADQVHDAPNTRSAQMTPSSILFENKSKTVVLLDLVRSIEEAQVLSRDLAADVAPPPPLKRLLSAPPPATPFVTPEPKNPPAFSASFSAQVAELMTMAAVEAALAETRAAHTGPWCLPRICRPVVTPPPAEDGVLPARTIIPEASHHLNGTIDSQRDAFLAQAPAQFDVIVLDPPWPNRSAKRKRGNYHPVRDFDTIRDLLAQIPIASRLAPDGLVAVWITNSSHPADLLTSPKGGIFSQWDVELVGEWTWLKVTAHGEPIVSLDATYRRPWERLLIARKRGGLARGALEPKVIIAAPEVHSRKLSLRRLFDEMLPPGYQGLEIFARNLTAGWWSWGNEVLLFQNVQFWTDDTSTSSETVCGCGCGDCASSIAASTEPPLHDPDMCGPELASS